MFDSSGLEIASKFIAIFAIDKCFPINARTWREGSDVTEVRRLHQQYQVTFNATQKHLAPINATWLNMTLVSPALSDSTPCSRTLAAILSLAPVSVDDAGAGGASAGAGRGCFGDCSFCRDQARVRHRHSCGRRLKCVHEQAC